MGALSSHPRGLVSRRGSILLCQYPPLQAPRGVGPHHPRPPPARHELRERPHPLALHRPRGRLHRLSTPLPTPRGGLRSLGPRGPSRPDPRRDPDGPIHRRRRFRRRIPSRLHAPPLPSRGDRGSGPGAAANPRPLAPPAGGPGARTARDAPQVAPRGGGPRGPGGGRGRAKHAGGRPAPPGHARRGAADIGRVGAPRFLPGRAAAAGAAPQPGSALLCTARAADGRAAESRAARSEPAAPAARGGRPVGPLPARLRSGARGRCGAPPRLLRTVHSSLKDSRNQS